MQHPERIVITCEYCGGLHVASYQYEGQFDQGPIYTAVCTGTDSWYEDNYTLEAAMSEYTGDEPADPMGNLLAA